MHANASRQQDEGESTCNRPLGDNAQAQKHLHSASVDALASVSVDAFANHWLGT
jgi:hypothetical protein